MHFIQNYILADFSISTTKHFWYLENKKDGYSSQRAGRWRTKPADRQLSGNNW